MRHTSLLTAAAVVSTAVLAGSAAVLPMTASAETGAPSTSSYAPRPRTGYTKQTLHFAVKVGPHHDQRCTVVGDLYRPVSATRAHRAPAVLTTNGFGGSKDDQAKLGQQLARRGYVVLSYSGLGFGGTTCPITLDDPSYDGSAASQLIDFLGGSKAATNGRRIHVVKRDRHGPIVGMIGGSYGGGIQFATVDAEMKRFGYSRVHAIVPIITWNDLNYSLAPNNAGLTDRRVVNPAVGVEKVQWDTLLFAAGVASGPGSGTTGTCPGYSPDFCTKAAQLASLGYPPPALQKTLEHASVHSYLRRIHVPTMLMQGEKDSLFNLHESVATYRHLRAQGTPTKLVWQSWGHTDSTPAPGEFGTGSSLTDTQGHLTYEGHLILGWFDHYLKGTGRRPSLDFSFFRDWADHGRSPSDAARAYGVTRRYPVGHARLLHLSGNDGMVRQGVRVHPGSQSFATPTGTVGTGIGETTTLDPTATPTDPPGTFARFETPPLTHATQVVGIPSLRLNVSAPAAKAAQAAGPGGRLILQFKLYDVAPDGSLTLPGGVVSATRLVLGDKPVRVTLPGIVHRFARGHRMALVVSSSDSDYRTTAASTPVTITTSAAHPGTLRLPVVRRSDYRQGTFGRN